MNNQLQELLKLTTVKLGYLDIFLNFLVCLVSTYFIIYLYNRYSSTVADKSYFSRIFPIFSISIFLIITVIQSSLALSLGLVGALSIIRFRTAIKEPEQLVYLLMITGVAIASAAGQYRAGLIGTVVFGIVVLIENQLFSKKSVRVKTNYGLLVIKSSQHLAQVELEKYFGASEFTLVSYNSNDDKNTYTYSILVPDLTSLEKDLRSAFQIEEFYYTSIS